MNVLLVYPRCPDTFWSFKYALKFVSKKAAFPPLGLLTIASMLPEEWSRKVVDLNVERLTKRQIEWADMVFISAMIVQKHSAQEIIDQCKSSGKTVVAGGPLFTTQHEQFENVDHFVLGEAETILPLLLEDLQQGNAKRVYRSQDRPDITKTPIPQWSLINLSDYVSIPMQYSRGCPFDCEFCDIIVMYGRIPRTKTPEQMVAEFQSLYDAGWRDSVFIVDDNFIGNKSKVKQMLPELIQWQENHKFPFPLMTEASVNLADDDELLQLMSAANFHKVFLGIETPDVDSLKECGKIQNSSRDMEAAVVRIQKHGMQVMGGFIVGFDNDSESIFQKQIDFIQNTGIVTAMVGILNALPETKLWKRLKAEGRLIGDVSGENTDGSLNFLPKMDRQTLLEGYKKIIETIYSPKQYYQRIDTFIRNYQPSVRGPAFRGSLKPFLRSIWRIGILSRARVLYWKLIIKTALLKRQAMPVAIELAILGVHCQKTAKKTLRAHS